MSLITLIVADDPLACFIQMKVPKVHEISREPLTFSNGLLALSILQNNYIPGNDHLVFLELTCR